MQLYCPLTARFQWNFKVDLGTQSVLLEPQEYNPFLEIVWFYSATFQIGADALRFLQILVLSRLANTAPHHLNTFLNAFLLYSIVELLIDPDHIPNDRGTLATRATTAIRKPGSRAYPSVAPRDAPPPGQNAA